MNHRFPFAVVASVCAIVAAGAFFARSPARADDKTAVELASETAVIVKPVEPDMHEFMEYVFQPSYKRLKPAMAGEPADKQGWKVIKAESLTLAESGNLLLMRLPKKDAADWAAHSVKVREFGGQLYKAAKARDYKLADKHYKAMIENCNACHKQFENGKHILAP